MRSARPQTDPGIEGHDPTAMWEGLESRGCPSLHPALLRALKALPELIPEQVQLSQVAAIAGISPYSVVHAADEPTLKIRRIGTGNIRGNPATLWAKAGHELVIA